MRADVPAPRSTGCYASIACYASTGCYGSTGCLCAELTFVPLNCFGIRQDWRLQRWTWIPYNSSDVYGCFVPSHHGQTGYLAENLR